MFEWEGRSRSLDEEPEEQEACDRLSVRDAIDVLGELGDGEIEQPLEDHGEDQQTDDGNGAHHQCSAKRQLIADPLLDIVLGNDV